MLGIKKPSEEDWRMIFDGGYEGLFALKERIASSEKMVRLLLSVQNHPDGPLSALGVEWEKSFNRKIEKPSRWKRISYLLHIASEYEGPIIFDALARSIKKSNKQACRELRQIAITKPLWAKYAIKNNPEIFGGYKDENIIQKVKSIFKKSNKWIDSPYLDLVRLFPENGTREQLESIFIAFKDNNINIPNGIPETTLLHSMSLEDYKEDIAEVFINQFIALIDHQDYQGYTPMHLACAKNSPGVLRALINCGARCDLLTKMGDSVLDEASKSGHVEVLDTLCKNIDFDAWSLKRAKSWARTPESKAYLESQMAKQAICEMMEKNFKGSTLVSI